MPVAHIDAYFAEALDLLDQGRPAPFSLSHRGEFTSDACQQPDARFQREGLPPGWNWRVCEPTLGRCFRSASVRRGVLKFHRCSNAAGRGVSTMHVQIEPFLPFSTFTGHGLILLLLDSQFLSWQCSMAYLPGGILDVVNRSELKDPSSMVARARNRMMIPEIVSADDRDASIDT